MSEESKPNQTNIIAPAEAIAIALTAVGDNGQNAEAQLVERLDDGNSYYLVTTEAEDHIGTVAAIDAAHGTIMTSARMEHSAKPFLISESQALRLADFPTSARTRLVWKASRASLSLLYPLWHLTYGTSNVYVDQSGKLWHELPPAGLG